MAHRTFPRSSCVRSCYGGNKSILSNDRSAGKGRQSRSSSRRRPSGSARGVGESRTRSYSRGRPTCKMYTTSISDIRRRGSRGQNSETSAPKRGAQYMNRAAIIVASAHANKATTPAQEVAGGAPAQEVAGGAQGRTVVRRSRRLSSAAELPATALPDTAAAAEVVTSDGVGGGRNSDDMKRKTFSSVDPPVSLRRPESLTTSEPPSGAAVSSDTPPPCKNTCSICLESILATDRIVDLGCTRTAASGVQQQAMPAARSSPHVPSVGAGGASSASAAAAKGEQRSRAAAALGRLRGACWTTGARSHGRQQPQGCWRNSENAAVAESDAAVGEGCRTAASAAPAASGDDERHEFHAVCFRQYIIFSLQNVRATPIMQQRPALRGKNERDASAAAAAAAADTEEEAACCAGSSIVQCPLPHCRREVPENIIRNLLVQPPAAAGSHSTCGSSSSSSVECDSNSNESSSSRRSSSNVKNRSNSDGGNSTDKTDSSSTSTGINLMNSNNASASTVGKRRYSTSSNGSRTRGMLLRGDSPTGIPPESFTNQDSRGSLITIASSSLSRLGSTLSACLQKPLQQQRPLGRGAATTGGKTATAETESVSTAFSVSSRVNSVKEENEGGDVPHRRNSSGTRSLRPHGSAARRDSCRGVKQSSDNASRAPRPLIASFTGRDADTAVLRSSELKLQQQCLEISAAAAAVAAGRGSHRGGSGSRTTCSKSCSSKRGTGRMQKSGSTRGKVSSSERPSSEGGYLPAGCSNRRESPVNVLFDDDEERGSFVSVEDAEAVGVFFSSGSEEDEVPVKHQRATRANSSSSSGNSSSNSGNGINGTSRPGTNSDSTNSENTYSVSSSKHDKEGELSEGAELYNIYLTRSFEAYADVAGDLVRCTTPGCGYAFWWPTDDEWASDEMNKVGGEICPKCRCSCLICGSRAHEQQSCEAAAGLTLAASLAEDQQQKRKKNRRRSLSFWRRMRSLDVAFDKYKKTHGLRECLRCGAVLHLESGCAKMRCRCGFKFCFVCGTPNATCRCRAVQGHGFLSLKEVCNGRRSSDSSASAAAAVGRGGGKQQQPNTDRRRAAGGSREKALTEGKETAVSALPTVAAAAAAQPSDSTGGAAAAAERIVAAAEGTAAAATTLPCSSVRRMIRPCHTTKRARTTAATRREAQNQQSELSGKEFPSSQQQESVLFSSGSSSRQGQRRCHVIDSSSSRKEQKKQAGGRGAVLGAKEVKDMHEKESSAASDGGAGALQHSERSCSRYVFPASSSSSGSCKGNSSSSSAKCSNSGATLRKVMQRTSTDSSWAATASSSRSGSTIHSRRVSDATDPQSSSSTTTTTSNENEKGGSNKRITSAQKTVSSRSLDSNSRRNNRHRDANASGENSEGAATAGLQKHAKKRLRDEHSGPAPASSAARRRKS